MGRLATYKYYNMDQIVAQALTVYGKMIGLARVEAANVVAKPSERVAAAGGNGHSSEVIEKASLTM